MEIWEDISGYEGLYEISSLGRIRRDGNIISATKNPRSGYVSVMLCKEGKTKRFYVHRLVAKAFIKNPDGLREVNHKDENKENNSACNLEWCNHTYNCYYGENAPAKSREKAVLQKSLNGDLIRIWESAEKAFRGTGILRQSIGKCCLGKRETAGGFIWEFA